MQAEVDDVKTDLYDWGMLRQLFEHVLAGWAWNG